MQNLLRETEATLQRYGFTWDNVKAIVAPKSKLRISVDKFKELANVDYNESYGAPKVATDLCIVMNNGSWLSREEYDGSEWWCLHKLPSIPVVVNDGSVTSLVVSPEQVGWCTLAEINKKKD